jgi:hypothetical protein
MPIGFVDLLGSLAQIVKLAQLVGNCGQSATHRLADGVLSVGDNPGDRHPQRIGYLLQQGHEILFGAA